MKRTVIVGSTTHPWKYAQQVAGMLKNANHPFIPLGIRQGEVLGETILNIYDEPPISEVDTITLYINPNKQKQWYKYFLSLKPKRIIFNPGTENQELKTMAEKEGIECLEACTLVMLSIGNF